jgi:uncharacterized protein YndB with AHSA1/START domain
MTMATQGQATIVSGTRTSYKQTAEREIVFERVYDAPREAVFQAFCDPKTIPAWWGGPGTTTRVEAMDVRTGGVWRFTQKDAKGNTHAFSGTYREVEAPKRIVSTFQYGMPGAPTIQETFEFLEQGSKTLLRVTSNYPSGAALGGMLSVGMDSPGPWIEGTRHQWRLERLAALVRK